MRPSLRMPSLRMPSLRLLLGLALAVLSLSGARAQDAGSAYVVTYIEVEPSAQRNVATLLRNLEAVSRKAPGNQRFETLRRLHHANHFVILEAWKDQKAQEAHASGGAMKDFRGKLQPLLIAPYDERPHGALAVGPSGRFGGRAIHVVTHVDIVPPKKDDGIAMSKDLAGPSRRDSGNIRYDVLQQSSRPNHMTLVEIWSDRKALQGHETAPHMKKYRDNLLPMSGSLYDQRLYKALR